MTDDETDPIHELYFGRGGWLRLWPGLLPEFGYCVICNLTATDARRFGDSVYAWCRRCRVSWRVRDLDGGLPGSSLLDLEEPDPDDDEQFMRLVSLAECIDLDPLPAGILPSALPVTSTISAEEIASMTRQTTPTPTEPRSFGIDPHAFQGARENRVLHPLPAVHRVAMTDALLRDMIEHCPWETTISGPRVLSQRAAARCWERVRDVVVDPSGATFGMVLRDPEVSPFAVRNTMELLLRLFEKRALLEAQLHALDAIAEAFRPAAEEVESA